MIALLTGSLLILLAAVSAWRTLSYAKRGKSYVWSDVSGRAVAGEVEKAGRPSFFRANLVSNLLSSAVLAVIGVAIIWIVH